MKHCPHRSGHSTASVPPVYAVKCCHCGKTGHDHAKIEQMKDHGPYAPMVHVYGDISWEGPCIERPTT